jgi:hypothetical protein
VDVSETQQNKAMIVSKTKKYNEEVIVFEMQHNDKEVVLSEAQHIIEGMVLHLKHNSKMRWLQLKHSITGR